jgi:ribosomal protein S6
LEKRKLAYEPREIKVSEGYYVVYVFTAAPQDINELQETLKLNDRVILSYFQNLGEVQPA